MEKYKGPSWQKSPTRLFPQRSMSGRGQNVLARNCMLTTETRRKSPISLGALNINYGGFAGGMCLLSTVLSFPTFTGDTPLAFRLGHSHLIRRLRETLFAPRREVKGDPHLRTWSSVLNSEGLGLCASPSPCPSCCRFRGGDTRQALRTMCSATSMPS